MSQFHNILKEHPQEKEKCLYTERIFRSIAFRTEQFLGSDVIGVFVFASDNGIDSDKYEGEIIASGSSKDQWTRTFSRVLSKLNLRLAADGIQVARFYGRE